MIWYIPYGMYHDIHHGIYHAKVVYIRIYTIHHISWYIAYTSAIYHDIYHGLYLIIYCTVYTHGIYSDIWHASGI
jgi:hypothetical protein